MADHGSIFKNNRNTYYPRFSFTPKTYMAIPETGVFNCGSLTGRRIAPTVLQATFRLVKVKLRFEPCASLNYKG